MLSLDKEVEFRSDLTMICIVIAILCLLSPLFGGDVQALAPLWFVAGIAEFLLEKFICKFLWKNLGPKFKQEKELRELKKQVEIEKLKKELEQLT